MESNLQSRMESNLQSRIPLSVSKRQKHPKTVARYPLATISLSHRNFDSLTYTKQCENLQRKPCSICVPVPTAKKAPAVPYSKQPPLDDYKGRYKNLLTKYDAINNTCRKLEFELDECKRRNEILEGKLAAAEAEVKSIQRDLRRMKTTNKNYELTIGVLERKIADCRVQSDENEEISLTRFGRSVRPPAKYQPTS